MTVVCLAGYLAGLGWMAYLLIDPWFVRKAAGRARYEAMRREIMKARLELLCSL